MILRLERERRIEALAQCPEGHDTRHYYGWLDDIDKKDAEIAALKGRIKELEIGGPDND